MPGRAAIEINHLFFARGTFIYYPPNRMLTFVSSPCASVVSAELSYSKQYLRQRRNRGRLTNSSIDPVIMLFLLLFETCHGCTYPLVFDDLQFCKILQFISTLSVKELSPTDAAPQANAFHTHTLYSLSSGSWLTLLKGKVLVAVHVQAAAAVRRPRHPASSI